MAMNKRLPTFFFSLLLTIPFANGQKLKDPDDFLVPRTKNSLPKIFLVGTFHFEYYNKDAYKVDRDKQVDIMSSQKQKELKELLEYISLFKPNKILVEAKPEWEITDKYRKYKSQKIPLGKDEIMQIAFRLVERFKLDTIYSIDAGSIADDLPMTKDSIKFKPYLDSIFKDYSFRSNNDYIKFFKYKTSLSTTITLLSYFEYINSPKVIQRNYGAYLVGDFKLGEFRGADALAIYWYDRNLRIFRNIQRAATSPNDRILVLFGADHIAILDQLLKNSPEYNYIKFNDLKE
jgi:hypothetical protein